MSERVIRLRLSPWMVQLVCTVLDKLPQTPGTHLVIPKAFIPEEDDDLQEIWLHSLLEQLEADFGFLRKILARLRSNGVADLDSAEADTFLRAVTAVRLLLQRSALTDLPEEDLQCDGINIETLPEAIQPLYACYLLLADIQGQIIAQIAQNEGILTTEDEADASDDFGFLPSEEDTPPQSDDSTGDNSQN